MKKLIVLIAVSAIFFSTDAQEEANAQAPAADIEIRPGNNALGVAVGATSAYGISYRRYIKRFAIQGTFAPFKTETNTQFHAGITFLYNLVENRRSNFFIYQSNYYRYNKEENGRWVSDPSQFDYGYYEDLTEEWWNHGLGVGFEFLIVRVVSLNLMGGYGAYQNFENIGFTGEAGLYYRF